MRLVRDKRGQYLNSIETENRIRYAILHLMQTKDLDKISVSDIAQQAQIERSTFYSHYQSIDSLIMDLSSVFFREVKGILENSENGILVSLPAAVWYLVAKIRELPLDKITMSNYWLPFSFAMSWGIMDILVTDKVIADDQEMLDRNKIRLGHFWGGVMDTLHAWLNGRLECDEEDLIAVLTETALQLMQRIQEETSK